MPEEIPEPEYSAKSKDERAEWRDTVRDYLFDKKRDMATEMMATALKSQYHFHTVKNEEDSVAFVYDHGIYVPQAWTTTNEFVRDTLGRSYRELHARDVMAKIIADTYIDEKDFEEKNPDLICLRNGIFNVRTHELTPHSPKHYFFTQIPVSYVPDAKCPNFLRFLEQVMHKNDIPAFQEFFGYCFYRNYPYAKALLLLGGGSNGKGTTLSIMSDVIGQENCEAISLSALCEDQFVISRLYRKLLNNCGDNGGQTIDDVSIIKQLTGNDLITANRKNQQHLLMRNYAKMVFALNNLPRFKDQSDGNFRRWMLIEFRARFYNKLEYDKLSAKERAGAHLVDEESIRKIKTPEEYSGIFNWCMEGLERLFKNNGFSYSKTTAEVRDIMVRKADPYTFFVNECLEEQEGAITPKHEVRELYERFAQANGLDEKINDRRFNWAVKNKFDIQDRLERIDGTMTRCFVGIQIKSESLTKFKPVTDVTLVTPFSTLSSFSNSYIQDKKSVTSVTSVTEPDLDLVSDEELLPVVKEKQPWTRFDFIERFSEERMRRMLEKGMIFEPQADQLRVLE